MASICEVFMPLLLIAGVGSGLPSGDVTRIPKCCSLLESYGASGCRPSNISLQLEFSDRTPQKYNLVVAKECESGGRYQMELYEDGTKAFHLFSNGSIIDFLGQHFPPDEYCLETSVHPNGTSYVSAFLCFPYQEELDPLTIHLSCTGLLVSVAFLLVTTAIFLLMEEPRRMPVNILISYWLFLAAGYACLAYIKYEGDNHSEYACRIMVFSTQFVFLSSYFWLNIFCFHTWRTMTGKIVREVSGSKQKTMLWYTIYGTTCPVCYLIFSVIMEHASSHPLKPNIGIDRCWFQDDKAHLLYFTGPVSILLVANLVFFVLTVRHLRKTPRTATEIIPQVAYITNGRKLLMQCLALFFAMGLNWILEAASFFFESYSSYGNALFFQITDMINMFYGTIVFLVFVVLDQRIRRLVLSKLFSTRQFLVEGHCPDPFDSENV